MVAPAHRIGRASVEQYRRLELVVERLGYLGPVSRDTSMSRHTLVAGSVLLVALLVSNLYRYWR